MIISDSVTPKVQMIENTILFVDDDPDTVWTTSRMLEEAGYTVLSGTTAAEAWALTQEHRPPMVLLDVELPDGNGVDVARRIKLDPELAGVFVVLVSGSRITPQDQADGLKSGLADGYVIRPFSKVDFLARIEAFLRIRSVQEELQKAKDAAEEANRAKSQFLSNMSHELRTPMTGVLGMLQLALEEDIAPVPRGYLETSLTSARSLLRILNDILDMAKIEAGKLTIEEKPFSLLRCITEAADIMTPEVRRKGLDFSISVAEEIPDMVVGDQMRLRQVLINLIGNAVKFTDGGKVVVRLTAERPTPDGQWEFTIFVTDTGIGISDDKKGLLFRTFSQVDDSHSRSFGGTGLGLAISRKIMELMGGTISFESKAGVGSTFSFTIPLEEASLKSGTLLAVKPQSTRTTTPTPEEKSRSLLLAEDDATIREVLGRLLKRSKYSVDFAEDGLEAVEMWEAGGYDLVLMDVQMPRLNGFEATRAIREKELECGCHTPIVAMTAHATIEDEQMCLDADMDAYISKPIDFKKTLQVIEEIFQKKSSGCC